MVSENYKKIESKAFWYLERYASSSKNLKDYLKKKVRDTELNQDSEIIINKIVDGITSIRDTKHLGQIIFHSIFIWVIYFFVTYSVILATNISIDWIGVGIQIRNAPISSGNIGYAIRWHGTSPALLWEADTPQRIKVNAWSLDKSWFSTEHIGETLLSKQFPKETAVSIHAETSPLRNRLKPESEDGGTFQ